MAIWGIITALRNSISKYETEGQLSQLSSRHVGCFPDSDAPRKYFQAEMSCRLRVGENGMTVIEVKGERRRQFRSKEERRRIVEETLKPGASVALVARANGVNANQVFKWRTQYRKGRLNVDPLTTLVPVKVSDAMQPVQPASGRKSIPRKSGIIDIDLGHARVRIEGSADPIESLRYE